MTLPIQVSGKIGDVIVVIGGNDPADFQNNLLSVLGPDAVETIGNAFKVALVDRVEQAIMTNAADVVMAAGLVPSGQPSDAVTQPSVPSTQQESGIREETDKWGGVWTYNVPGAPACPHGPRVQKKATSQAGKPYVAWCCPTTSPFAYRQKITKADCKMEFAK
jgi:hypothetical protein